MNHVILLDPKGEGNSGVMFHHAMNHLLLGKYVRKDMIQNARNIAGAGRICIPPDWEIPEIKDKQGDIRGYDGSDFYRLKNEHRGDEWIVLKRANTLVQYEESVLQKLFLQDPSINIYAVKVLGNGQRFSDQVRRTSQGQIAGFRRCYHDSVQILGTKGEDSDMLWLRGSIWEEVAEQIQKVRSLEKFLEYFRNKGIRVVRSKVAGSVWDLDTEKGLLSRLGHYSRIRMFGHQLNGSEAKKVKKAADVHIFGDVIFGSDIQIEEGTIVIGPSVIGDGVKIGKNCLIHSSVIDSGHILNDHAAIQNQVLLGMHEQPSFSLLEPSSVSCLYLNHCYGNGNSPEGFRRWPEYSYPLFWKRLLDIFMAVNVLLLFVPVYLFIALAIKLSSKGPVFFPHRRQGLHGRTFYCLKARTMIQGADQLQQKLRGLNQADGPQFMMEDDPRVSTVGKFLRDTCLDEIPQFINVLKGEMSVVGPRPSPRRENSTCPPWRDARLSVRPGITGLWQVCRTRREGQDFQEWVFYDMEYVKNISLKLDLWICWKTVQKMLREFAKHF